MKKTLQTILGFLLIGFITYGFIFLCRKTWTLFTGINPTIAAGIITGASTIIVATITISFGRYLERKKEIEAHYRTTKTEIYNDFIKEFFGMFFKNSEERSQEEFVAFMREWQRKMIIWGGEDVLAYYIKWMSKLKLGTPDADSIFMTEELFRLIRKDLGNKSGKLQKGFLAYIMLQNPELFLSMASKNPKITLAELSEMEKFIEANTVSS